MRGFSFSRFGAVLSKEFIQMRRDHITFAMMIGLPIIQLMLFGFAINADPRHLPTLVELADNGPLARAIISGMQNSTYFDFRGSVAGRRGGEEALRRGEANFVVVIPQNFERDVIRGRARDPRCRRRLRPSATGGAVAALSGIVNVAVRETLDRAAAPGGGRARAVLGRRAPRVQPGRQDLDQHRAGALAIILSMTMVMITAVAIVKEIRARHHGDADRHPGPPVRGDAGQDPALCARRLRADHRLPRRRAASSSACRSRARPLAFFVGFNIFIVVNLALGFLISTLRAIRCRRCSFRSSPSCPRSCSRASCSPSPACRTGRRCWAPAVPATHFLLIVRKVMLKGGELGDITGELMALTIILVVISAIAMLRYRQTLD
jgi:ABC-2 type transport system permease protein